MKKKAIIAMSGGVDSSVAAHFIKEKGFDCIGVTLKLYDNQDAEMESKRTCCSLDDVEDARRVACQLGISHYVFNFRGHFGQTVIRKFIEGYEEGATPNPCIDCNKYIKFDKLHRRAKELDYDYVVTGHYARIDYDRRTGRYLLKKALDGTKDQSYVLYAMTQEQLASTLFPLGNFTKEAVRDIALQHGLTNAKKQDSQDICFVPDGDYIQFIQDYTGKTYEPGNFVDQDGKILGTHRGIIGYTIGQRKGLGLAIGKPMYVCSKNREENTIILGEKESLLKKSFEATDLNWIAFENIDKPIRIKAKIRYQHDGQWAIARPVGQNRIQVEFDEPQRAIAKGQAVVLYDDDIVVGGGTIV